MAANFWEEIFGEQILLNEFFYFVGGGGGGGGGKTGNNFFLKQIFLGGNFRDQVLEDRGEILVRRKFCQQKYFGGIFVSKMSL